MRRRTLLSATATATAAAGTALVASACGAPAHPGPAPTCRIATATARPPAPSASASPAPADWTALAHSLEGKLVRPGDADYATARQLYNTRYDGQKPDAVAYVAHPADVQECLAYARDHRTPISIRSGGHSYAGWSSGTGRLVIDVTRMNSGVNVSGSTVGAGTRLIDFYRGLAAHGRTCRAGPARRSASPASPWAAASASRPAPTG